MLNNNIVFLEEVFGSSGISGEDIFKEPAVIYSPSASHAAAAAGALNEDVLKQGRVDSLIWAFREVGYIYGELNPLGNDYQEHYTNLPLIRSGIFEKLTPGEFGLGDEDLDRSFYGGPACGDQKKTLREILDIYSGIYCASSGYEFLHIHSKPVRKWFIENLETLRDNFILKSNEKKIILEDLIKTEEFEHFLNKTYIGQKRFSIEGAESVIPCLHFLVDAATVLGVKEIVIGTTHRGRLTILDNILQLPPEDIFNLFEENFVPDMVDGGGDVKYHIGYTMIHNQPDGSSIRVTLPPNASHLESVDSVAEGRARGIQDNIGEKGYEQVIPVILHGEAAFSGQGVVYETLNLSLLEGYSTGGTIHIIINNQVGFTTSTRSEHSSSFVTDIAKAMSVPVIHVNGDDPVQAAAAVKLSIDYRRIFKSDILIDIICYRKYGHNEGDDPSFTHPRMYEIISKHKSVAGIFLEECIGDNITTAEEAKAVRDNYARDLKTAYDKMHVDKNFTGYEGFYPHKIKYFDLDLQIDTRVGIGKDTVKFIAEKIHKIPEGFKVHEKLERILENRYKNFTSKGAVDWAFAESLAFGSLLLEGSGVRLSGQDSERGTFAQRHLVWWEIGMDEPKYYIPLNHIKEGQAEIHPYDSPLSEYSILGFEFGYSISCPGKLVIWEAQFGDFANGAQVIIDNFLIASEAKWGVRSGLVLLLPHGYEGQGPEHSNGHMERFLQLSAQENIQVCNVTTPVQYFCLLRRQVKLCVDKPLVIMAPKSLLRHPLAVSNIDEFTEGRFQYVIDDSASPEGNGILKLLFCTGKIYYDLIAKREKEGCHNCAIVRIEQLYPFPGKEVEKMLKKYGKAASRYWVQEEPKNRGAWDFVNYQFENAFNVRLEYIGRKASASPVTGSLALFKEQQENILKNALM